MSITGPLAVPPIEAAEIAGLSRTGIFDLIRTGDLPSLKVGRRRLVLVEDLQRFLADERDRQMAVRHGVGAA